MSSKNGCGRWVPMCQSAHHACTYVGEFQISAQDDNFHVNMNFLYDLGPVLTTKVSIEHIGLVKRMMWSSIGL